MDLYEKARQNAALSNSEAPRIRTNSATVDAILRKNLHPAVYNYLAKRDVSVHGIKVWPANSGMNSLGGEVLAFYEPIRRQVWIKHDTTTGTFSPETVIHEIGHAIDFNLGSELHERVTKQKLAPPKPKILDVDKFFEAANRESTSGEANAYELGKNKRGLNRYVRTLSIQNPTLLEEYQPNIRAHEVAGEAIKPDVKRLEALSTNIQERALEWGRQHKNWFDPETPEGKIYESEAKKLREQSKLVEKRYGEISDSLRTSVTQYGSTAAVENFAESFRVYRGLTKNVDVSDKVDRAVGPKMQTLFEYIERKLGKGEFPFIKYQDIDESAGRPLIGIGLTGGGFYKKLNRLTPNTNGVFKNISEARQAVRSRAQEMAGEAWASQVPFWEGLAENGGKIVPDLIRTGQRWVRRGEFTDLNPRLLRGNWKRGRTQELSGESPGNIDKITDTIRDRSFDPDLTTSDVLDFFRANPSRPHSRQFFESAAEEYGLSWEDIRPKPKPVAPPLEPVAVVAPQTAQAPRPSERKISPPLETKATGFGKMNGWKKAGLVAGGLLLAKEMVNHMGDGDGRRYRSGRSINQYGVFG